MSSRRPSLIFTRVGLCLFLIVTCGGLTSAESFGAVEGFVLPDVGHAGTAAALSPPGPSVVTIVRGTLYSGSALGELPTASSGFVINISGPDASASLIYPQGFMYVTGSTSPTGATVDVDGQLDFTPVFGGDWMGGYGFR